MILVEGGVGWCGVGGCGVVWCRGDVGAAKVVE